MVTEVGGPDRDADPSIARIYVDQNVVFEASPGSGQPSVATTKFGNLNNAGQFPLYSGLNYYRVDSLGNSEIVKSCCEIASNYYGDGGAWTLAPKIDGQGEIYYVGSTVEQMPPDQPNYNGVASIYQGQNADVIVSDLILREFVSDVRNAEVAWDVNERGDVIVNNWSVLTGEEPLTGVRITFRDGIQTSLNNLGQSTRFGVRNMGAVTEQVIAINDGIEPVLFPVEGVVSRAFLNDQRQIFYETGSVTRNTATLNVLDGTTGETTELIAAEDLDVLPLGFRLYDANSVGQFALAIHEGLYIGEVSELPVPDLNFDAEVTPADIDRLLVAIDNESGRELFDLNQDGVVSGLDATFWIEELVDSRFGDADLNGEVNFADFLVLSRHFASSNTGWAEGDFDGSGTTDFTDFQQLSANFGFERSAVVPVPEPSESAVLLLFSTVLFCNRKLRKRK